MPVAIASPTLCFAGALLRVAWLTISKFSAKQRIFAFETLLKAASFALGANLLPFKPSFTAKQVLPFKPSL